MHTVFQNLWQLLLAPSFTCLPMECPLLADTTGPVWPPLYAPTTLAPSLTPSRNPEEDKRQMMCSRVLMS